MDNNVSEILGKVTLIDLGGIHIWSGRRKLKATDLKDIEQGKLPPEKVASLGSKKIFDPEQLREFDNLKKAAHRACANRGTRFLSGYAIPDDQLKDLVAELSEAKDKFNDHKAAVLADYDDILRTWVEGSDTWQAMLEDASLDRSEVENRIGFGWTSLKLAVPEAEGGIDLSGDLLGQVNGLAGTLYDEIAQAAALVMEKSLMGRDKVTQKILSPIRTIRSKMLGLSFLDKRVKPIIETIDHITNGLPPSGHIDGMALSALHGLVFILSDKERMIRHGQAIVDGLSVEEAVEESVPTQHEAAGDDLAEDVVLPSPEVASAEPSILSVPEDDLFGALSTNQSIDTDVVAPPKLKRRTMNMSMF